MTDTNQIIKMWVPMMNPSDKFQDEESQYTRDWIASHNCKVLDIDEQWNLSAPDVLLEGTIQDLHNLISSKDYGIPQKEADQWIEDAIARNI